jgi:hypothetical protein
MDANQTVEEVTIPEIEAAMAADEAEWAKADSQESEAGRDQTTGRFTSADKADDDEAPEDAEGDEAESGADHAGADADGKPKGPTEAKQSTEQKQAPDKGKETKAEDKAKEDEAKAKAEEEDPARSKFVKNQVRQDRTWKVINANKEEAGKRMAAAEEKERHVKLMEEQFAAQVRAQSTPRRDAKGRTADDYRRAATDWKAKAETLSRQAIESEAAGDFAEADRLNNEAAKLQKVAADADAMFEVLDDSGPQAVWRRIATEMPEVFQVGNEINLAVRQMLKTDPKLMADPMGAFVALVRVGRQSLTSTREKLKVAQTEASKVPELQKTIAELTKKVGELTTLTSVPGSAANLSREGISGRRFEDMSLDEMEANLPPLG